MKLILILVLVALVCFAVKTMNEFKRREIKVQESLSGIEVALTKRYDMLTKLQDAAKGYLSHENELFTRVIRMRQGMSIREMDETSKEIDEITGKLYAVAEGYPELRSSEVFVELQKGISDAEEHLQAARRLYNAAVTGYNTAISMFPACLLAGSRQPLEFFSADESRKADVDMKF